MSPAAAHDAPPLLVPFGRGRPGLSSVLIHPAGGGLGAYAGVGLRLSRLGTVTGIRGHGLAQGEDPDTSVAALTARYRHLLAGLPGPPDLLFGWSLGGVLAWELAAELAADPATKGHRTRVVMVDSPAARIGADHRAEAAWRRRVQASLRGSAEGFDPRRVAAVTDAHLDAVTAYQARRRNDCPALLVACEQEPNEAHIAAWRQVAPNLTVRSLPGDHFTAFDGGNLPLLLGHLTEFLNATNPESGASESSASKNTQLAAVHHATAGAEMQR